mmetsp:Transcript_46451/g.97616  ORF Transcript_46451/g.97616 Transcript_46451/m.97616 type:complete len:271 (+) Transcript_46451:108-920(+)
MENKSATKNVRDFRAITRLSVVPRVISNINETTPWDVIIPASFFAASAVCWVDPSMAPSIVFALLAFATIFVSPVMAYYTKPVTVGFTDTLTDALNTITDDSNSEQRDKLFFALADLISKTVESDALRNTIRVSLISSLMDEELHGAVLNIIQTALVTASEDEAFRSTALDVVNRAFTGALNDEVFVRDLMSGVVGAMVQASKEEELTQSILDVVTRAVSQALADERFVAELRGAVKDTLSDGTLYKAGARGMVSAVFGQANDMKKSLQK